jgi:beta-lactamase superfamily II metal-dependent hydrolase
VAGLLRRIARRRRPSPASQPHDAVRVTLLPNRHGGGQLVELPGGEVVLIAMGRPAEEVQPGSVWPDLLHRRGCARVSLVLLNNPQREHTGDLFALLQSTEVGPVCITPQFEKLADRYAAGRALLRRLRHRRHPVRRIASESGPLEVGDARVELIWPPAEAPFAVSVQESGMVARASFGGRSVLLCGAIREDAQSWLAHQADVRADAVALAEPGSVNPSTLRFLTETGACDVVCGPGARDALDGSRLSGDLGWRWHEVQDGDATEILLDRERVVIRRRPKLAAAPVRRAGGRVAAGLVLALLVGGLLWPGLPGGGDSLSLTVLSVGKGTAAVVEMPDGQTWLYDAGGSGSFDPGRGIILPYLRSRGIRHVDRILISHPNMDHFGGLPSVLQGVRSGPVYLSPHFERVGETGGASHRLLAFLRGRGHPVASISADRPGPSAREVAVEVLWPPRTAPFALSNNDTSVVVRLRYAGVAILLPGDIEKPVQQWLMDHTDVSADVLLLPHHGSERTTLPAFIAAVAPRWLIQSSSERGGGAFGTPPTVTGDRTFYSTADCGAVTVRVSRTGRQGTVWITGFWDS